MRTLMRTAAALWLAAWLGPVMAMPQRYVDAVDYPSNEANWDRFYDLERRLQRDFDHICGDTFCEGDFSNLQALHFRCSVEQATGEMGECVWTFAGSLEDIDSSTGRVQVDARTWQCKVPLAPKTSIEAFHAALDGSRPMETLDAPLPGTGRSIYDGLTDCL